MMEKTFKKWMAEALEAFFESERGEALIGMAVLQAIRIHFNSYKFDMEKTHADGGVEKFTFEGDPLAHMCQWIKNTEGAIRGVQSDAAQARNKSIQARDNSAMVATVLFKLAEGYPAAQLKNVSIAGSIDNRHRGGVNGTT